MRSDHPLTLSNQRRAPAPYGSGYQPPECSDGSASCTLPLRKVMTMAISFHRASLPQRGRPPRYGRRTASDGVSVAKRRTPRPHETEHRGFLHFRCLQLRNISGAAHRARQSHFLSSVPHWHFDRSAAASTPRAAGASGANGSCFWSRARSPSRRGTPLERASERLAVREPERPMTSGPWGEELTKVAEVDSLASA